MITNELTELTELKIYHWILIGILLLLQSLWLFRDAQKRSAYPWLWGLWGLAHFPTPIVVYLIVVRKIFSKRK